MMVWILADDRMGNVNQLLGIAEALELPYERKDIRYTKWVRLPNIAKHSNATISKSAHLRCTETPSTPIKK